MLVSAFKKNTNKNNSYNNTRKPRRSSWAVGVARRRSKVGIAPPNDDEKQLTKATRRGKSSMPTGRPKLPDAKYRHPNINAAEGVIAVDIIPPLMMTQDELRRAKKKCHTTARRLHKIKRRLLLDIAEEQNITSEVTSNVAPSTVERSVDQSDQPTRHHRRGRRNCTASFMPQHQGSDSTMEAFFGASSSSFGSSFDDTEIGAGGD